MNPELHKIDVSCYLVDGKWVIYVKGVTSGAIIHGGDGDNMTIEFKLDASRFRPVFTRGER